MELIKAMTDGTKQSGDRIPMFAKEEMYERKVLVVGTPIGNLSDFSPVGWKRWNRRILLPQRIPGLLLKLLNHFGIKKPLVSYL